MANIMAKFTLYDFLSYTIPGLAVLLSINIEWVIKLYTYDGFEHFIGYLFLGFILFGYVLGMALSEFAELICTKIVMKTKWFNSGNEVSKIGFQAIGETLKKANIINDEKDINSEKDVIRYWGYMYADIQANEISSQVHSFISSDLICKNMMISIFISSCFLCIYFHSVSIVLGGVVLSMLYLRRWKKQSWRKLFYTTSWFVQKHNSKASK